MGNRVVNLASIKMSLNRTNYLIIDKLYLRLFMCGKDPYYVINLKINVIYCRNYVF